MWYRFAHPMLGAAATHRLTPTRRRRLADALIAAPSSGTDVVRRAMWQLDTSRHARRRAAARRAPQRCSSPSRRWHSGSPSGRCPTTRLRSARCCSPTPTPSSARSTPPGDAQALALTERSAADDDLLRVRLNEVSLTAFSDRRPDRALELLAAARAELPAGCSAEIDSMARSADGLLGPPGGRARRWPSACSPDRRRERMRDPCVERTSHRAGDRRSVGRGASLADRVLADLAAGPTTPVHPGHRPHGRPGRPLRLLGRPGRSGHRPVRSVAGAADRSGKVLRRPSRCSTRCSTAAAACSRATRPPPSAPLREAVAQQRIGEGLLRSEAVALLVVALAASRRDRRGDASCWPSRRPTGVAIYSGLRPWAESAVEAVAGRPAAVTSPSTPTSRPAPPGSPISAVAYLAAAARYGAAARAAAELDGWGHRFESPISAARATRHRRPGRAATARAAARRRAPRRARPRRRRRPSSPPWPRPSVGIAAPDAAPGPSLVGRDAPSLLRHGGGSAPVVPLTRRELEIATLAARGMTDRDIAATLVISVRTVESHLAAAYRKLGDQLPPRACATPCSPAPATARIRRSCRHRSG